MHNFAKLTGVSRNVLKTVAKFRIYLKSNKIVWTRSRIILSVLLSTLLIFGLEKMILGEIKDNQTNEIIGYVMLISFALGIVNNFFREELKGKLTGHIIFFDEKIQISEKVYLLSEIKLIQIEGYDYFDRLILYNFPSGMFSSGVNNTLTIFLYDGNIITTNFQKNYEDEMRKINKQLTIYKNEGKLKLQSY